MFYVITLYHSEMCALKHGAGRSAPAVRRPSGPVVRRPSGLAVRRPAGPAVRRPSGPAVRRPSGPAVHCGAVAGEAETGRTLLLPWLGNTPLKATWLPAPCVPRTGQPGCAPPGCTPPGCTPGLTVASTRMTIFSPNLVTAVTIRPKQCHQSTKFNGRGGGRQNQFTSTYLQGRNLRCHRPFTDELRPPPSARDTVWPAKALLWTKMTLFRNNTVTGVTVGSNQ